MICKWNMHIFSQPFTVFIFLISLLSPPRPPQSDITCNIFWPTTHKGSYGLLYCAGSSVQDRLHRTEAFHRSLNALCVYILHIWLHRYGMQALCQSAEYSDTPADYIFCKPLDRRRSAHTRPLFSSTTSYVIGDLKCSATPQGGPTCNESVEGWRGAGSADNDGHSALSTLHPYLGKAFGTRLHSSFCLSNGSRKGP